MVLVVLVVLVVRVVLVVLVVVRVVGRRRFGARAMQQFAPRLKHQIAAPFGPHIDSRSSSLNSFWVIADQVDDGRAVC